MLPLTELTKGSVSFTWTDREESSFEQIKALMTSSPTLLMSDITQTFQMETNSSDFAIGGVHHSAKNICVTEFKSRDLIGN